MYLFHVFRSFLPLRNPIGFGAADFVSFAVTALLVLCILLWPLLKPYALKLTASTRWCMLILAALPIVLRLLLLPSNAAPLPRDSEDSSRLLLADTLLHARLANPPHPFPRFFEAGAILQQPTYSSVFPLGQGIALAAGHLLVGQPWAGVLLAAGLFCALSFWMLRTWVTPDWALLGAFFAIFAFGPLSYWMNTFSPGAVSAGGACLVFGSLPRLQAHGRTRDALLLGAGIALQLLVGPFEAALLAVTAVLFFTFSLGGSERRRPLLKILLPAALAILAAILLLFLQSKQVTGSWTGLHALISDSRQPYFERMVERLGFIGFFLYVPLYISLGIFPTTIREWRLAWVLATLLLFLACTSFYPSLRPDALASLACLVLLAAVTGLRKCSRQVMKITVCLCATEFLFWYGLHLVAPDDVVNAMHRYEVWDFLNPGDNYDRLAIDRQLRQLTGKQLIFVRSRRSAIDWIRNAADIDRSRVVWARDLGTEEDEKLRDYYRDRAAWLLNPDSHPVRLEPFRDLP